jgi:hypothetical protein
VAAIASTGDRSATKGAKQTMVTKVVPYQDALHAETPDVCVDQDGYKYRMLEGVVMPPYVTPDRFEIARTIETRPLDIAYCSYPKSGSTWLAHIIFLILHEGQIPEGRTLRSCLHWMESSWPYPCDRDEVDALPSPRIFKSHMPHQMAFAGGPANSAARFVYIARNPKDVCVSYYHFETGKDWSGGYETSWEGWLERFLSGCVQRGSWFDHVLSWWAQRERENLLFLRFEDLKRDFGGQLDRLIAFIGKDISPAVRDDIIKASSFEEMKQSEFTVHAEIPQFEQFFRKGEIGSWKDRFTVAQSEAFDRICAERLAGSGLEFDYE